MKKYQFLKLHLWGFLLAFIFLFSCGKIRPEGKIQSKNINIAQFSKLDLQGKYRLFFVQSKENFINIETYPNLARNLEISIQDNTLSIHEKRKTAGFDFYTITIYGQKALNNIKISDSIEMNISGNLKSNSLKINLEDQAKFIGNINTQATYLTMADKSRANFGGSTEKAFINISNSASLIAPFWFINFAKINSKNENYAEINALSDISGNINDSAQLIYYGDPNSGLKIGKNTKVIHKKQP